MRGDEEEVEAFDKGDEEEGAVAAFEVCAVMFWEVAVAVDEDWRVFEEVREGVEAAERDLEGIVDRLGVDEKSEGGAQ